MTHFCDVQTHLQEHRWFTKWRRARASVMSNCVSCLFRPHLVLFWWAQGVAHASRKMMPTVSQNSRPYISLWWLQNWCCREWVNVSVEIKSNCTANFRSILWHAVNAAYRWWRSFCRSDTEALVSWFLCCLIRNWLWGVHTKRHAHIIQHGENDV